MSALVVPNRRTGPDPTGRPDGPVVVGLAIASAALRVLAAEVAVVALIVVWVSTSAFINSFAVQFCGWPATISCDDPSPVWSIATIGLGLVAVIGALTALSWAWSNRGGVLVAAYVGWMVLLLVLALNLEPRQFNRDDIVLVGGFAGLAIELLRQTAILWMPGLRRQWSTAAASAAIVYLVVLGLLPVHLASLAPS